LIAQPVRELALVQQLVREQELRLELQLAQALVQELQQVQALVQQLVLALVPQLPHQQLQSRFQRQRFHLLQHEFLSTLQQLAKALRCQLCL
jgi:hypothetical protein